MDADLRFIAEATGASSVKRGARIQSLWGGYGELHRVHLEGARHATAIVKSARPPAHQESGASFAHARKCRSYDVETAWYQRFAARCDERSRVATLLASRRGDQRWLLVLEDLDAAGFSLRRHDPSEAELLACVAWLAHFHARFFGVAPDGLWEEGTYWHLATRPDELAAIDDRALREAAPRLDAKLRGAVHRTLVHGDAKEANFCFAPNARGVAAVDFQYVGGGCGMRDLAYLLRGHALEIEERAKVSYFRHLRSAFELRGNLPTNAIDAVEAEWRSLYPIAWVDFDRFLAGWSKERWMRDDEARARVREVLRTL